MSRKEVRVFAGLALMVVSLFGTSAYATNDLSLVVDPGTECVSSTQTVTVTLEVRNLSAAINGVQVRLHYDTSLMTLVDIVPTDLGLGGGAQGWVEVSQTDTAGDIDWAAVINGSSIGLNHTIATMTFTAVANGTAGVTFRADSPPFVTKLTRASDNSTITPTVADSGGVFIGPPDCTISAETDVCDGTSGHVATVPDAGVGATYAWTVTGGTIDSGQGTSSISYTATDPSSVTIDVTVTDANGCDSTCQEIVNVNANPDCTITAAASVCANSTSNPASVPDAGVGANYVWTVTGGSIDSGQGTSSLSFSAGTGPTVTLDITVTDANGCVSTCQKIISVSAPDCTITAADDVCDGSTGNIASVPDAGAGSTYTWIVTGGTITSGQGTTSITYTATDPTSVTIDVTVVGGAGCQSSCQKIVNVNANPDATISAAAAVCDGTSGHVATVADAGVGASYVWAITGGTLDSGQGTTSISYTATDPTSVTIDVTVTDGNGCVGSDSLIVSVNANPDATISAAAAVCDGTSGNSASVADAGVGSAYVWAVTGGTIDSGQGTTSISYTATDPTSVTIDVTVTDGNGCVSMGQTVVSINANPDCTITAADAVCDGSTGNSASVPDSGVGATYVWAVTGGTLDSGQGSTAISYTAGAGPTLTIDITVTDANGCVSSCQKVVNVASNPSCTITAADAVCDGSTGNAASTADVGAGATYDWVVTGGTIASGQNTPSITYDAGAGPTVVLDLTVTDAGGCISVCQKIVTVNPNPDATISASAAVCDGTSGHAASVADAGVGASYVWAVTGGTIDSGQGTTSISYTATDPTSVTIDVTVTDGNGCVDTGQAVVSVNANPDATISAAAAVCDGTSGHSASVADAGVGATYLWGIVGGTIDSGQGTSSISYSATDPSSISIDVTVTDANSCVSSDLVLVGVNPNPDATITTGSAVCDGTSGHVASVADAGVGAGYVWAVTGGTIDSGQGTASISFTATDPTSVTVDVTVTDGNGCVGSDSVIVSVNANPACLITAESDVCATTGGHSAFVSDAGVGATYIWAVTGGTLDSGQGTTAISYTAGAGPTVTLDVTVTDSNGCVSSCQWIVNVDPNPNCTISANDLVCSGFSGNVASVPDSGVGATYNWTVTGGALNSGQGTTSISYTAGTGTSLTVDITVNDANGCISSCQKIVTVDAPNCTILGANDVCFQSTNNFASVTDAGVGATYLWAVTGGTLTGGQGTSAITYSAGSGTSVTLDVTVTNSNGCVSSCQKIVNIIQPSIDVTLELEAVSSIVTRDVTFVITDCPGTTDVRVLPVTTDATGVGTVTIPSTSPFAGWVSAQEGHTLKQMRPVTYGVCSVASVNMTGSNRLLTGDFQTGTVSQDNLSDITDYSILASRWNMPTSADASTGADATGDGFQDSLDFAAMQANFFVVGTGDDGCPASGMVGLQPIGSTPIVVDVAGRQAMRSSMLVAESDIPNVQRADMNFDGVIDVRDIREFAIQNGLELTPEFQRRLDRLAPTKVRTRRTR